MAGSRWPSNRSGSKGRRDLPTVKGGGRPAHAQLERDVADRMGGRRQPCSGAIPGFKGDVKLPEFLVDTKYTVRGSYALSLKTLQKVDKEARGEGREPLLLIHFAQMPIGVPKEWVLIPATVFEQLTAKEEEK